MFIENSIKNVNPDYLLRLNDIIPSNQNYYYLDINHIDLLDNYSPSFQELKLEFNIPDDTILLLDCAFEGYRSIVDKIYKTLITSDKWGEEQIVLISGAADIIDIVNYYANLYDKKSIKSIFTIEFERMLAHQIANMSDDYLNYLQTKTFSYNKSYICLNKRWRLHRPTLVAMLNSRKLLDKGYVSLTEADDNNNWNTLYESIVATHKDTSEIDNYFRNHKDEIMNLNGLILDQDRLLDYSTHYLSDKLDNCYLNSYFSVVNETNFYTDPNKYISTYVPICEGTRFFTEKVFKPMIYNHPFILVTVPKSLQLLKDLGYKTFAPYINEDYDNELDDGKRLLMILDEIERLSNLSEQEVKSFVLNTLVICQYNFKVLMKRSGYTNTWSIK